MPQAGLGGAQHEAVLYSTPDELARRLAGRLAPALDDGGPVVAVLDETTRAEVRRALGPDAQRVEFPDPAAVHRVPAFTVAVRWARLGRQVRGVAGRAVVVGQHVADLPGCEGTYWARLDIGLNVAVAGLPIDVLCPYPADHEHLPRVHATHPHLTTAGGPVASAGYRTPTDAVIDYPAPPPPDLGPPAAELAFTVVELPGVRALVDEVGRRSGIDRGRVADLVLAVNEIGSNSLEHGPGHGRARLWADAHGVTVDVADPGLTSLPFPGMIPPATTGLRGRGLWLASELCDVLQLWSDVDGTLVRLRMDADPGLRSDAAPIARSTPHPAAG